MAAFRARWGRPLPIAAAALALILLTWVLSIVLPPGVDWGHPFRPAALALISGHSPYHIGGFLNPPWALLPLTPLALLPEPVGRAALLLLSLLAFAFTAYRLGAKPVAMALFLLSPPVLHCLLNGNLDWLVLLGFVMTPRIGLFLVSIKPQVGAAVALFWLVEAWRRGGGREIVRVFWPVTVCTLASFVLYGLWPLSFQDQLTQWWNASLWPFSIPVGLALLAAAFHHRRIEYAMGAGPCLSPYVLLHAWSGAIIALVPSIPELAAAVAGIWLLLLMGAVG